MAEIKNRIAEALEIRGLKQVELSQLTGIPVQTINPWKNNHWQPKQTPLYKMAKALNVSEMWLAGYDVPMERPIEQRQAEELLEFFRNARDSQQLHNIVTMLSELNSEQLNAIESVLKTMVD